MEFRFLFWSEGVIRSNQICSFWHLKNDLNLSNELIEGSLFMRINVNFVINHKNKKFEDDLKENKIGEPNKKEKYSKLLDILIEM